MAALLAGPDRVFEVPLHATREAGLVGRRRVPYCTPSYDAVAMMDTVTPSPFGALIASTGSIKARNQSSTAAQRRRNSPVVTTGPDARQGNHVGYARSGADAARRRR